MSIDLDSGNYTPMDSDLLKADSQENKPESADLQYEVGAEGVTLKAVNGAQVQFPLETLCQQGTA
jgi:hypothetical protein